MSRSPGRWTTCSTVSADDAGPVVRRIAAVDAAAPFGVAPDVVLRELDLARGRAQQVGRARGSARRLRPRCSELMRHVVLTDLDRASRRGAMPAPDDALTDEPGANARWYSDPVRDAYAWLDSPRRARIARSWTTRSTPCAWYAPPTRCVSAGTTLRTSAGYEIFIDADSGSAVFALRTEGNDRLFLLRADESGQRRRGQPAARVRDAARQPADRVPPRPVQLARGGGRGVRGDRVGVADVGADVLGAFAFRRPSPDLVRRAPRRRRCGSSSSARPTSPRSPTRSRRRSPSRDPSLAARVAVVADLEAAAPAERARYLRGIAVPADGDEATRILRALGDRGMKVTAIDRRRAFEDVRRVGLDGGRGARRGRDVAGVRVPRARRPGSGRSPSAATTHDDVPAWLPDRHHRGGAPRRAQQHRRGGRARRGADDPRRAVRRASGSTRTRSTSSPACSRGSAAGDRLAGAGRARRRTAPRRPVRRRTGPRARGGRRGRGRGARGARNGAHRGGRGRGAPLRRGRGPRARAPGRPDAASSWDRARRSASSPCSCRSRAPRR